MTNFKKYDYNQQIMISISLSKQILPGTFEYTLNKLINDKFKNDETGATAYDSAILLK